MGDIVSGIITATPDTGYKFTNFWSINDVIVSNEATYQFSVKFDENRSEGFFR